MYNDKNVIDFIDLGTISDDTLVPVKLTIRTIRESKKLFGNAFINWNDKKTFDDDDELSLMLPISVMRKLKKEMTPPPALDIIIEPGQTWKCVKDNSWMEVGKVLTLTFIDKFVHFKENFIYFSSEFLIDHFELQEKVDTIIELGQTWKCIKQVGNTDVGKLVNIHNIVMYYIFYYDVKED